MDNTDKHLDGDALCDYAEGALDAGALKRAEVHLQVCAECRRELQAVRGYFKEMSILEPVQAPANFLANVRARLPQPSPWRAAWTVFMRPWRAVPLQIALAAILGVTAITAYLHQRGGLSETPAMMPVPVTSVPSAASPAPAAPASQASEPGMEKDKAGPAAKPDRADRPAEEKESSRKNEAAPAGSGFLQKKQASSRLMNDAVSPRDDRPAKPRAVQPAPPAAPNPYASAPAGASKGSAGSTASTPPPVAAAPPVQGSGAGALSSGFSGAEDAGDADEKKALDQMAPAAKAAPATKGAPERQTPAPRKTKSEAPREAEAMESADVRALGSAAPKQLSAEEIPGFTVRLRSAKDTTALLAGLRAMGAATEARPGVEPNWMLDMPRSMLSELQPYLERYGKVGKPGIVPAAGGAKVRVSLRAILP